MSFVPHLNDAPAVVVADYKKYTLVMSILVGVLIAAVAILASIVIDDRTDMRVQSDRLTASEIPSEEKTEANLIASTSTVSDVVVGAEKIATTTIAPIAPPVQKKDVAAVETQTVESPLKHKPELASFVKSVVSLECYGKNDIGATGYGTGISFYDESGHHYIGTNAHVVRAYDGSFDGCYVYFPDENGIFYQTAYWAGNAFTYDKIPATVEGYEYQGIDYALLELTEPGVDDLGNKYPDPSLVTFPDINAISEETCTSQDIAIGNNILVFGYPGIGGDNLTATDGVIAGFDGVQGEYLKTSAKVEFGNSGGLAIRSSDGCLLGIPTALITGEAESLGRILSFNFIGQYLDAVSRDISSNNVPDPDAPISVPLYPDFTWDKKTDAHREMLKRFEGSLTFDSVCEGYTMSDCSMWRTISLPKSSGDNTWTARVTTRKTTLYSWQPQYEDVMAFYDAALMRLGFVRGETVFVPESSIAIVLNDYQKKENSSDGGIFRYARVTDGKLQFVVLDVDVVATYTKDCPAEAADCDIEAVEEYALFVSAPISVSKFMAREQNSSFIARHITSGNSLASVFAKLKSFFTDEADI